MLCGEYNYSESFNGRQSSNLHGSHNFRTPKCWQLKQDLFCQTTFVLVCQTILVLFQKVQIGFGEVLLYSYSVYIKDKNLLRH